jgi:hypothetical protein
MKQYIEQYNEYLDLAQDYIDKAKDLVKLRENMKRLNNIESIKDMRKNEDVDKIFGIVENSNDRKAFVTKFSNDWVIDLTYNRRKNVVYFFVFIATVLSKRRLRTFFRHYLFWSALLCRENFNLRDYKSTRLNKYF